MEIQDTVKDESTSNSWLCRGLAWLFPETSIQQWRDIVDKFNVSNLLFCYCLPFFYVFYPTWLMPAIFLKSLSFVVGCLYRLISRHHGHYNSTQTTAQHLNNNNNNTTPSSSGTSTPIKPRSRPSTPTLEDERNHLYFWLQRCSICLEQTYSLCLESCRDQFCKDCFARYTEETVQASWGLGVTRIKCPVCQEVIPQAEWSRYVSKQVVDKYNAFNQPYRPFMRHCAACENEVIPCQSPRQQGVSREMRLEYITDALSSLKDLMENNADWKEQLDQLTMFFQQTCQKKGSTFRIGRVQDLYQKMIPSLARLVQQQQASYQYASLISKQLVAMEVIPEAWKQTQFWHVAHFPLETCDQCGLHLCLQCGEKAHVGMTCMNWMIKSLQDQPSSDQTASLQWKIKNTYVMTHFIFDCTYLLIIIRRPCPNCSVMINRDEGCNRVDCLLCGHRFCWRCLSSWTSQTCGFYQCGQEEENQNEEKTHAQNGKAELGVPNMTLIDSKRRHS
ncbi:uncharacterized protein BX664DRAFT_283184 [Halteromyces radiatus]|uniref:uncharacterized protein n=1 Tax=Halteromyces radiatus TaxID=101107 RepID=UPI00221E78D7|nr:uncharacterized protein BX664DRAFT_283184 [Halteromyces radiatus]KAI8084554.1 hypothetical protein BX664DRAFT_283184 [Halteromyces radiatus]